MKLRFMLAAVSAVGISCAPHPRVARFNPPVVAQQSAFDRQIQNARDMGDGDYQLRVLRQRVAAEPDSIPARLELAQAYRDRAYPDMALELCRLTVARFPESGDAELALVRSLRDLNQRTEALASLEAFLAARPQSAPVYFSWLGLLHDEMGQWTAGEPEHRKAIAAAPATDYLHNNLGYNLLMQKRNSEAAAEFREALRLNSGSEIARNNLGLALAGQNEPKQAVETFQAAADPATAHNNMAAVLMEKGNYPEARRELEIALGYNRTHPAALKNLELVSRLDGTAATLPLKSTDTRWDRWKAGFIRLFVGPLEETKADAGKTPSAQLSREER